ncbi:MAG TPA: hypothetical protein DCS43_04880, partial [Verrucomicrobia bacterium]|nr:hypothetical protein [Verrucomicrobiota bacterium]
YAQGLRGSNPWMADSNLDGTDDGLMDSDGDGLRNRDEANLYGTDVSRPDSDGDGISDLDELEMGTDPVDDLSPFVLRHLRNNGYGWLEAPGDIDGIDEDGMRFDLADWSIEVMTRLTAVPTNEVKLVQRRAKPFGYVTFELGVQTNLLPYVRFESSSGREYRVTGAAPLALNQWVMLGGRFGIPVSEPDISTRQLSLFVDGVRVARDAVNVLNARGPQYANLMMGRNLIGDLDEVRIWRSSVPDEWLDSLTYKTLLFGRDSIIMGSLRPNVGLLNVEPTPKQHMGAAFTLQAWVKSNDDGMIVDRVGGSSPHDGQPLYNYQLGIEGGSAIARMTAEYVIDPEQDRIRWATHTLLSENEIEPDVWTHLALVYDGSNAKLYVNGIEQDDRSIVNTTPGGPQWHLLPDEEQPEEPINFNRLATDAGGTVLGRNLAAGLLDEVSLQLGAIDAVTLLLNHDKQIELTQDVMMYFNFDFFNPNAAYVQNQADSGNFGTLLGEAEILIDTDSNAPLTTDSRDILTSVLAGYFSMKDGRASGDSDQQVQDAVSYRGVPYYTRGAATLMPSTNHIDFVDVVLPVNGAVTNFTGAMQYPQFFPLPPDSPWRLDSDGDGMPDVFEQYFWLAPDDVITPNRPDLGPWGDLDGDGLPNIYEYWAGSDPTFWDSTGDGIADADADPDGDGLSSYTEYLAGSHPGRPDTDDDGIEDVVELQPLKSAGLNLPEGVSNPSDAMDPIVGDHSNPLLRYKSLRLAAGSDRLEIPRPAFDKRRFNTASWTVETWFRPATSSEDGSLLEYVGARWVDEAAEEVVFYRLGLDNGQPYVELTTAVDDTTTTGAVTVARVSLPVTLQAGEWVHLAGTFDPATRSLALYRDGGVSKAALEVHGYPLSGSETSYRLPGRAWIGDTGLCGHVDQSRIWSVARTDGQVNVGAYDFVQLYEGGMIANFRCDDGRRGSLTDPNADGFGARDGQGTIDFAHPINRIDLETVWAYSLRGVIFDADEVSPGSRSGFDDADGDGLADSWEDLYFTQDVAYYDTTRSESGLIVESLPSYTSLRGSEDYSSMLPMLGWSLDFAPLEPVYERRLWEEPDAAYYLKSFQLPHAPQHAELRIGYSRPEEADSRRIWINGMEVDLMDERILRSPDTFEFPAEGQAGGYLHYYLPREMLEGVFEEGHNRIAAKMINDDGNESYEFLDMQLLIDGVYYIRHGSDTAGSSADTRWWVYG